MADSLEIVESTAPIVLEVTQPIGVEAIEVVSTTTPVITVEVPGVPGPEGPQGPPGAGSPDATATAKGSIRLAGDLGGTANLPTVVSQADRAYVRSFAATDLVSNGTGYLKDNTNFSNFTFDPTDSPVGGGSFDIPTTFASVSNDELIPIDLDRNYQLSFMAKQKNPAHADKNFYAGIAAYDIDGLSVAAFNYMYYVASNTTLAQPLNPGDTVMYLTSAAGWNNGSGGYRTMIAWNYVDGTGRVWPVGTYSRWRGNANWNAGAVDLANNSITLNAPYNGVPLSTGHPVANNSNGGNYMYIAASSEVMPLQWTLFSGKIRGRHNNPESAATKAWPYGTAFAKVLILPNYGATTAEKAGSRQSVAVVSFTETRAAQDDLDKATFDATGGTLIRRATTGHFTIPDATVSGQPVSKGQLDAATGGGAARYRGVSTKPDGSYTLALADEGKMLYQNSASAHTFTIPTNATVPFPIGSWVDISQGAAGATSIVAAAGVTLIHPDGSGGTITIRNNFGTIRLYKYSVNSWIALRMDTPTATAAVAGVVELATTTEATTGTDTTRAVTPAGLKAVADTKADITYVDAQVKRKIPAVVLGNVGDTNVGTWSKIGTATIVGQFGEVTLITPLSLTGQIGGRMSEARVTARVKQDAALGSPPAISVWVNNIMGGQIQASDFSAVIESNTSTSTVVGIWFRNPLMYSAGFVYEQSLLVSGTGSFTYGGPTNQANLPAGTKITGSAVETRGARFDAATSIYNAKGTNTRRLRTAAALARLDQGLFRVGFMGDSVTAGHGVTRGVHDPVTLLLQRYQRMGYRVGELVHFYSNRPEPRITYTGTWFDQGQDVPWKRTNTAGSTFSYTGTGRYIELVASNQSVNFTYSVDGAAAVTVTTTGAATYNVLTIDAITDATHTIVVTTTGTGIFYAVGMRPATGIVLENAGISGATTSNFLAAFGGANVMTDATYYDLDAVVVELGANDMYGNVTPAVYKTKLIQILNKITASGATPLIAVTHTPNANTGWNPYIMTQYQVADELDVPLLDLSDRMGWLGTTDDFEGQLYDVADPDGLHLTAVGNTVKAQAWLDFITPGDNGGVAVATDTISGTVELATVAESTAGTDTARAMTPAGVKAAIGSFAWRPVTIDDLPTSGIISAHRGSSRDSRPMAPEASVSAYRLAVALGAHIIDVDNQITADGVPVVMHDTTLDATTSGTGNVADRPLHLLPPLSMPEVVGAGWSPEPVPTVEQILAEFGGRVCITIEPKTGAGGVDALAAIIKKYGLTRSVYLNTNSMTTAQAITDAGCMPHVYGVTTEAGIASAAAAGAKLVEIPYNASTAVVNAALTSGIHRVIAGPIAYYEQLSVMTPGIQGYVSDSVGYLGRPSGLSKRSVRSLAPAIAARKRGAGWRVSRDLDPAYADWLSTDGLRVGQEGGHLQYYTFGDISGTPAASGSILCTFRFVSLPADISQRVGLRVMVPEENTNGLDTSSKGYVISLRANGTLNMWTSPLGAYGGGTALGTSPTGAALTAGTDYQILFEWTSTQVRLTRVDTSATTGWVNNTDWRGPFITSVATTTSGQVVYKDIVVTEP